MRTLPLIVLFACAVASVTNDQINFNGQNEWIYKLEGQTVIGGPFPSVEGNGVQIDQTVRIIRQSQQTYIIKCEDIKVTELRNKLSDNNGQSSSSSSSESSDSSSASGSSEEVTVPVSKVMLEILQAPIEVHLNSDRVEYIQVKGGTPTWAINMKRALVTHFYSLFEQTGDLPTAGTSSKWDNQFQVQQNQLYGNCPVTYKYTDLGSISDSEEKIQENFQETLASMNLQDPFRSDLDSGSSSSSSSESSEKSMEKHLPRLLSELSKNQKAKQWCNTDDRAILLVKSVNLTGCSNLATLSMGHPTVELNNTNPLYGRDVVILNVGCGTRAGEFKTLAILTTDTLNIGMEKEGLPGFKQITTQLASLKEVRPATSTQGPANPITVNGLSYEFTNERPHADDILSQNGHLQQGRHYDINIHNSHLSQGRHYDINIHKRYRQTSGSVSDSQSDEDSHENLDGVPIGPMSFGKLDQQECVERIKGLLRDVTEMFKDSRPQSNPIDTHNVMDKFQTVVHLIRSLPKDPLQKLYSVFTQEGKSSNNRGLYTLYFNALLIAGTGPSLSVCDSLTRNNNIDVVQKAHYLLAVPKYVRFPSKDFIRQFKNTVSVVASDKTLGSIGLMSLASVTYQACVNSRVSAAKFPVEVTGELCDKKFAHDEVLSFFMDKLWDGIIKAGQDEQKAVLISSVGILGLPEVVPQLEQVIKDSKHSTFVRAKAVFAYNRLVHSTNGNEAVSKKFVIQTVLPNLLAHFENEALPSACRMAAAVLIFDCEHSTTEQWSRIARSTLKSNSEIKKFIATSFRSMEKMDAVSRNHQRMKQIAQSVSNQLKGIQHDDALSMNIYTAQEIGNSEVELFGRFGILKSNNNNNFLHMFTKGVFGFGDNSLELAPFAMSATFQSRFNDIWKNAKLYTQINLWNEVFFQTNWNAKMIEDLFKSNEVGRIISIWLSESDNGNALRGRIEQINVQKAIMPMEQVKEIPTILGYPVTYKMSVPVIFSTVGQIGLKGQGPNQRVQGDFYVAVAGQIKHQLSVKVPYTMKEYTCGFERNLALELPLRVIAQKGVKGGISLAVTPTHLENDGKPTGQINLMSYEQLPYTAVVRDPWAKSLQEKYIEFRPIQISKEPILESEQYDSGNSGFSVFHESETEQHTSATKAYSMFLYSKMNITLDLQKSPCSTLVVTTAFGPTSLLQQSSISDSNSNESGESQGNGGYLFTVALTGKKAAIPALDKQAATINEISGPSSQNIFQYLIKAAVSSRDAQYLVQVAGGEAANKAALTLPETHGHSSVKQAIVGSPNSQQQSSGCVQFNPDKMSLTGGWLQGLSSQISVGKTCAVIDLHEIQLDSNLQPHLKNDQANFIVRGYKRMVQHVHSTLNRVKQYVNQHLHGKENDSERRILQQTWTPITPKIVNGLFGQRCQFPYTVALMDVNVVNRTSDLIQNCGGALIRPNVILTAAHCLYQKRSRNIKVLIGTKWLSDQNDDSYVYDVAAFTIHESYDPNTLANDIAMIWLSDPVTLNKCNVQTVALPTANDAWLPTGEQLIVSGWGRLYEGAPPSDSPNQMRYVTVPFIQHPQCAVFYPATSPNPYNSNSNICAGYSYGGQNTCQGDSGGPVVRVSNGVLVGLVSYAEGCARPIPTVYTKVWFYLAWINSQSGLVG